MKKIKIGLLTKIIIAIVLGIIAGLFCPAWFVRLFLTFNGLFSQFLGFAIPLIIVGLVTTAIADIGNKAGRLLIITVLIAYGSTLFAGFTSYLTGAALFPSMIQSGAHLDEIANAKELAPFFTIEIAPLMGVMTAIVLAFVIGLGLASTQHVTLMSAAHGFEEIVTKTIKTAIIPLLSSAYSLT